MKTAGYPSASTTSAAQLVRWLSARCSEVAARAAEAERLKDEQERLRLVYERAASSARATQVALLAFVALLIGIAFGAVFTPVPRFYPLVMFGGLVAAGATGATSRALFLPSEIASPNKSLLLGAIAGLVVGFAYLIPQWVGAPGVLDASAATVAPTDKIQFFSSVLIAISAGVGFDTVFNRMKKQAENQPLGLAGVTQ